LLPGGGGICGFMQLSKGPAGPDALNRAPLGWRCYLSSLLFHPATVLIFSLGGALFYGAWATWRYSGANLTSQYVYTLPIVVPFIAFLFDRASEIGKASPIGFVVDALVVGTALMRVFSSLPFVSGHALFLTYAMLRPGSLVTRITATIVMLEVVYLKFFVWHDLITPVTGITLGLIAALVVRRIPQTSLSEKEQA